MRYRPYNREAYVKNREHRLSLARKYRESHREEIRLRRKENPEVVSQETKKLRLERNKKWLRKNIEKRRQYYKTWKERYPDKFKAHVRRSNQLRRARTKGAAVNPASIDLFTSKIRASKKVSCYYCRNSVRGKDVHIDHIIPLAKGGAHSVENLCATCPQCNMTKSDTMIQDWMRLGQQILAL